MLVHRTEHADAIPQEDSRDGDGHKTLPDTARYLWHTWFMGKMTDEERAEFESRAA